MYFGIYGASCKIISVTPKRFLKKQLFERKAIFPAEKEFWHIFSQGMEHDKRQATIYKGPRSFMTFFVQKIRSFLAFEEVDRNKHFQNRCFQGRKAFWVIFPWFIESDKPQGTFYKVPQGTLTITVENMRSFLSDLRGC